MKNELLTSLKQFVLKKSKRVKVIRARPRNLQNVCKVKSLHAVFIFFLRCLLIISLLKKSKSALILFVRETELFIVKVTPI